MPRSLGRHQIAICQRSGVKCRAKDLVTDGRIPGLLVLPQWADPPHPQEHMPPLEDRDGAPRWDVSPDQFATTAPVLAGGVVLLAAVLTWSAATTDGPIFTAYQIYRGVDDGDLELLATVDVDFATAPTYAVTPPTTYSDDTIADDHVYSYRVAAIDDNGRQSLSNVIEIDTH
jgi:hypothetical protein